MADIDPIWLGRVPVMLFDMMLKNDSILVRCPSYEMGWVVRLAGWERFGGG